MSEAATILPFPGKMRVTLPPDAIPNGRERHVDVFPLDGAWAILETDNDGGYFADNLGKREAVLRALDWVQKCNATMAIHNRSIWEDGP